MFSYVNSFAKLFLHSVENLHEASAEKDTKKHCKYINGKGFIYILKATQWLSK